MWSRRLERVNELLREEVSRVVIERQDPDVGFVTFTGVKATDDLMQARVYFSVLGSEEERARTRAALERLRPELRREMRRLESLKRIPELTFVYDETPERAARVFEILDKIHQENKPETPPPEARRKDPRRPASDKNTKSHRRKRAR